MQMGPRSQGPTSIHPDQILRSLNPWVERTAQEVESGAPLGAALKEALLTGILVGAGNAPTRAAELTRQWRMAGLLSEVPRPAAAPQPAVAAPLQAFVGLQTRQEMLRSIEEDMQDEATASVFYAELAEKAREAGVVGIAVDYITHAMEDEQAHYRVLRNLYQELSGGRTYEVEPGQIEYESLAEGLQLAMDDEYEAMEHYRDLYLQSKNDRIRDIYFELLTDELEHATRFQYVLQLLQAGQS